VHEVGVEVMRMRGLALVAPALVAIVFAACSGGGGDDGDGGGAGATAVDNTSGTTERIVPSPTAVPFTFVPPTRASGTVTLATTTSTQDSGLLDLLLPMFEAETGYDVQAIAVDSQQAVEQASRGEADVALVHSPDAEKRMVADGNGIERTLVMHNDFIIVGPETDPAAVLQQDNAQDSFREISTTQSLFISRGDNSGTHALEMRIWQAAAIDPAGQPWYQVTGQGMAPTLQAASERSAYTLTDRATYVSQEGTLDLAVLHEGDFNLLNVYHVIVVNPERHPGVNATGARAFAAFITRPDVQQRVGEFGVDEFGRPLFFPDAGGAEPPGSQG
jgi:tungstate transport system substrate-binding protein